VRFGGEPPARGPSRTHGHPAQPCECIGHLPAADDKNDGREHQRHNFARQVAAPLENEVRRPGAKHDDDDDDGAERGRAAEEQQDGGAQLESPYQHAEPIRVAPLAEGRRPAARVAELRQPLGDEDKNQEDCRKPCADDLCDLDERCLSMISVLG